MLATEEYDFYIKFWFHSKFLVFNKPYFCERLYLRIFHFWMQYKRPWALVIWACRDSCCYILFCSERSILYKIWPMPWGVFSGLFQYFLSSLRKYFSRKSYISNFYGAFLSLVLFCLGSTTTFFGGLRAFTTDFSGFEFSVSFSGFTSNTISCSVTPAFSK